MNTLDIAIELHLNPVKVSSHNGGEYSSACPMCGGNDRFRVWPEKGDTGAFWCRGCGKGGDAITLLIEKKGMTFKAAAAAVGKALTSSSRQRARTPREPKRQADWIPREISAPAELWLSRAAAFAEYCHKELLGNAAQLAWLEARGITAETAVRFSLGWNPKALFRKRPSWGLPVKKEVVNGVEKVKDWFCLPQGLVIPWFVDGQIHRLRIRKPEGEPRYFVVPGSGMAPMTIFPGGVLDKKGGAWVVVESELDAVLIAQEAGDFAGAAALGSVATKPDGALYEALKISGCILVALDADEAGEKGWPWWKEHFTQADRWIVPRGKDPGDYRKEGGDIRAWVVAGLPPGLKPVDKMAESVPAGTPVAENQSKTEGKGESFYWISTNHDGDESKTVEIETPAPQLSGDTGQLAAEPLFPYDGTWPPINWKQAAAMGMDFHEIVCEKCGAPRIYLWPKGSRPPQVPKCCTQKKPEVTERKRRGRP